MTTPDSPSPVLEEAAQAFADATAEPPYLFDLSVEDGRRTVDSTQDGDFPDPAATRQDLTVPGGPTGEVSITVYRPAGAVGTLPVVLYTHGAGWVFGDAHTHDRLVRALTPRAEAATVFVSYSLSPEARYPVALEQIYTVLEWIAADGAAHARRGHRVAPAGQPRRAVRAAAGAGHQRRGGRAQGRGRGLRRSAPRRGRPGHLGQVQRHDPRLRHAQRLA